MHAKEIAVNTMQQVIAEIVATANDIDAYLASDVPLECHRKDIDRKMGDMKTRVATIILENAGLTAKQ